jgi:hypothetical protein
MTLTRIEINVQTGEAKEVALTSEEIAALPEPAQPAPVVEPVDLREMIETLQAKVAALEAK